MNRRRSNRWTRAEIALLARRYPHEPAATIAAALGRSPFSVYDKAHVLGLEKHPGYLRALQAATAQRLARAGTPYRFPPGHRPANQGVRRPGWAPGRMADTQFKPGQVSVRWDPEIYCVGALRIDGQGDLQIKLAPGPRQWKALRRYVWESEVGPIPPRMCVAVKNGDPHDTRLENLQLLSRAGMMLRNSLHRYPKEIVRTVLAIGVLHRQINKGVRHEREDAR